MSWAYHSIVDILPDRAPGRWIARALIRDGAAEQCLHLGFLAEPSAAQVQAMAAMVANSLNPPVLPTSQITCEDGTTITVPIETGFALTLTAGQRTTFDSAIAFLAPRIDAISDRWRQIPRETRDAIVAKCPRLQQLFRIARLLCEGMQ